MQLIAVIDLSSEEAFDMHGIFAVLLCIGQNSDGVQPSSVVQDLEAGIRKNRELLRHGSLQIKTEGYSYGDKGKTLVEQAERSIWFDGKRTRVTWVGKTTFFQDEPYTQHAAAPFNSTEDALFFDNGEDKEIGVRFTIKRPNKNSPHLRLILDPKTLGLYPMPVRAFSNYKLDGLLSVTNFKGKAEPKDYNGMKAYEITYDGLEARFIETKTQIRMVVVPGMGHSVPEIDLTAIYEGKPYRQSLVIDVKQTGKSKIWFPSKLRFKQYSDNKIVEEETADIIQADFDSPPSDSAFRIASMNIPAGTPVDMNDSKPREWDGEKIVEKARDSKFLSKQFPDLPPAVASGWSSFWLWLAGVLTVAGGGFLYWAWRRKPA